MTDTLAAEWIKIRTISTTAFCLGLALASVALSTLLTLGMVSACIATVLIGRRDA